MIEACKSRTTNPPNRSAKKETKSSLSPLCFMRPLCDLKESGEEMRMKELEREVDRVVLELFKGDA